MKMRPGSKYETMSRPLVISAAFLVISITFGYYWLLLKDHSLRSSVTIVSLIENYYSEHDHFSAEDRFKNITAILTASGKPILLTRSVGGKEYPVYSNRIPRSALDEGYRTGDFLQKNGFRSITRSSDGIEHILYYMPDDLTNKIRFYPAFLFVTIFLVFFVTFYLYMFMRRNEKQSIWLAMAKETAHQLGTPLTSLKGWAEYLKTAGHDPVDTGIVAEGLAEDTDKIDLVVKRFSKISVPEDYQMCNVSSIIRKTVSYISKRIPSDPERLVLTSDLNNVADIYANPVLLEWAFENILKNAVESLSPERKGDIRISVFEVKNKIIVEIGDNGNGIPGSLRKKIFKTGFTTKRRGWGLGLSLATKVIEQYHRGTLKLKQTSSEGSIFRIELNKYI